MSVLYENAMVNIARVLAAVSLATDELVSCDSELMAERDAMKLATLNAYKKLHTRDGVVEGYREVEQIMTIYKTSLRKIESFVGVSAYEFTMTVDVDMNQGVLRSG